MKNNLFKLTISIFIFISAILRGYTSDIYIYITFALVIFWASTMITDKNYYLKLICLGLLCVIVPLLRFEQIFDYQLYNIFEHVVFVSCIFVLSIDIARLLFDKDHLKVLFISLNALGIGNEIFQNYYMTLYGVDLMKMIDSVKDILVNLITLVFISLIIYILNNYRLKVAINRKL